MEEDWEKTLILAVTILIIGGFVISPKVRVISVTHYFTLFLILFFISLIQTYYLKKWADDEKKTDYNLAYWIYCFISGVIFLYLIFILGLNPKLKSLKGGANQFAYDTNINIMTDNQSQNIIKNIAIKGFNTVSNGVASYTNFWKRIFTKLFSKNDSYAEGTI